ncbi:hypothetical protein BDZ45DRAFT_13695 [Acephala macrosclerotiorum]|nr:hypothetical protein BDZ45DRAFT_13695 [Acephala macrosclerotiorum]
MLSPLFPLLHASRLRSFCLVQAHLVDRAAVEIYASSKNSLDRLSEISMLRTFYDANNLKYASHWLRYELSQL